MNHPFTGLLWPLRMERAEVTVVDGLPVGVTNDWVKLSFVPEINRFLKMPPLLTGMQPPSSSSPLLEIP